MATGRTRSDRALGRTELAINRALVDRPDIGKAARAALRVQAHAVDIAETMQDVDLITLATNGYLAHLRANGLTSDQPEPVDAFEKLLADLGRPSASPSNTAND